MKISQSFITETLGGEIICKVPCAFYNAHILNLCLTSQIYFNSLLFYMWLDLCLILRTEQNSLYFLKNFEFMIKKKKQNSEVFPCDAYLKYLFKHKKILCRT